jgi:phosphoribosylanthranilate isomerase
MVFDTGVNKAQITKSLHKHADARASRSDHRCQLFVRYLELDAYRPGIAGGTGETFDWNLIPARMTCRIVLAGGLTAGNVAAGIGLVRPWAVDVSSGVEAAPGVKDVHLVRRFAAAVRRMDVQLQDAE